MIPYDWLAILVRAFCRRREIYSWPLEKDAQSVHIDVENALTLNEASLTRTAARDSVELILAMEFDMRDDVEAGNLAFAQGLDALLSPLSLYCLSRHNPAAAFKALIDYARRHSGAGDAVSASID